MLSNIPEAEDAHKLMGAISASKSMTPSRSPRDRYLILGRYTRKPDPLGAAACISDVVMSMAAIGTLEALLERSN